MNAVFNKLISFTFVAIAVTLLTSCSGGNKEKNTLDLANGSEAALDIISRAERAVHEEGDYMFGSIPSIMVQHQAALDTLRHMYDAEMRTATGARAAALEKGRKVALDAVRHRFEDKYGTFAGRSLKAEHDADRIITGNAMVKMVDIDSLGRPTILLDVAVSFLNPDKEKGRISVKYYDAEDKEIASVAHTFADTLITPDAATSLTLPVPSEALNATKLRID